MNTLTWTDAGYAEAIQVLGARTGLSFRPRNPKELEKGVKQAMARSGARDLNAYVAALRSDSRALDDLIVELTVGETYFFREPAQFEFLRRHALPEIMRRLPPESTIRAWSAGCASGEEPYSLAMLLAQEGLLPRAHILATDISRAALQKARDAVYPQWSLRGGGAKLAKPFLRPRGELHQLQENIRRSVNFDYLNLALDVYPAVVTGTWSLNLILCRNVLIYFEAATIANVARRLHDSLAEGGWLITSSADPALDKFAPFDVIYTDDGVFYRRSLNATLPIPAWPPKSTAASSTRPFLLEQPPPVPTVEEWADDQAVASAQAFDAAPDKQQPAADSIGLHDEARRALARGELHRAIELSAADPSDPIACAIHVQALANFDTAAAEQVCAAAAARHPLSAELGYLHTVLLLEADRNVEAVQAARRLLCLDRTLSIAHFTLGSLLRRQGDTAGALRAFRNCRDLCSARPAEEQVPLADAETCASLARAADDQLRQLDDCLENKHR